MAMKDRSKQLSKTTWKDPTRSLSRLAKIESKLVALFRNYRKRVLAELKPAEHPFTQMEPLVHGGPGSGNFGHAGRPGEVGGSGPGGAPSENVVKAIKHYSALGGTDASRYPATVEQTHEMHQWLEKGTIEGPVWRGEGYSEEEFDKLFDSKVEVGGEFQSNHPLSFTHDEMRKGAYGPGDYKIYYRLEGKATGRDIADWSVYKEEKEVLIAPNTRFKVVSRESKSEGHRWYVTIKPIEEPHTQKAPQWPASFSIEHFYQRLEDLTTQELIGPANAILEKEIPDAFTHGTKYADLNLKAKMGIKLGAPLEERQRAWQKVGALVEKSKGEFKGVSDAVNQQIRRAVADGMVNEDSLSTVTKRIQEVAESVGENRARMIARTETMKAINTGVKERYKGIGVTRYERLEADDERTCTDFLFVVGGKEYHGCSEIDGLICTQEEADEIDAQSHPNCRGSWIISEASLGLSEDEEEATQKREALVHGGEGSGNFGHEGRPGEVGGSGPGGGIPKMTQEHWLGDNTKELHEYKSKLNETGVKDYRDDYYKYGSKTAADIQNIEDNYFGTRRSFEVNDELRFGDLRPSTKEIVDSLDRIGTTHGRELPSGIELYRGVGVHSGEYLAGLKPGDVCEDKAFQSFTYDSSHAYQFSKTWGPSDNDRTFIRAITVGGEKALHNPDESEILFPRGTSWKVISNDLITPETGNPQGYAPFNYHIVTVIKK